MVCGESTFVWCVVAVFIVAFTRTKTPVSFGCKSEITCHRFLNSLIDNVFFKLKLTIFTVWVLFLIQQEAEYSVVLFAITFSVKMISSNIKPAARF